MTTKVTLTPKRKYTFDDIGEFVFQSSWNDSKGIGINQHLVKIMQNSFDAEWDSETDKFKINIIPNSLSLNFGGDEIRERYKSKQIMEK